MTILSTFKKLVLRVRKSGRKKTDTTLFFIFVQFQERKYGGQLAHYDGVDLANNLSTVIIHQAKAGAELSFTEYQNHIDLLLGRGGGGNICFIDYTVAINLQHSYRVASTPWT